MALMTSGGLIALMTSGQLMKNIHDGKGWAKTRYLGVGPWLQ
jgi:hypothetical protein